MSSNTAITVTFNIRYKTAAKEQTIALLGSDAALGRWDLQEPTYAQPIGGDRWEVNVNLTRGSTVYWSSVVLDNQGKLIRRESTPRRRTLMIPDDGSRLEVVGEWNHVMMVNPVKQTNNLSSNTEHSSSNRLAVWSAMKSYLGVNKGTPTNDERSSMFSVVKPERSTLVTFRMKHQLRPEEDVVALIGSHQSLGCWDVHKAAFAQHTGDDTWEANVLLTSGTTVFWSTVALDSSGNLVRREANPRRRKLTLDDSSPNIVVSGGWDQEVEVNSEPRLHAPKEQNGSIETGPAAKVASVCEGTATGSHCNGDQWQLRGLSGEHSGADLEKPSSALALSSGGSELGKAVVPYRAELGHVTSVATVGSYSGMIAGSVGKAGRVRSTVTLAAGLIAAFTLTKHLSRLWI